MNKMTFKSGIYAVTVTKKEGEQEHREITMFQEFDDLVEFYTGLTGGERLTAKPQRLSAGCDGLFISHVGDGQIWERAYRLREDKK